MFNNIIYTYSIDSNIHSYIYTVILGDKHTSLDYKTRQKRKAFGLMEGNI